MSVKFFARQTFDGDCAASIVVFSGSELILAVDCAANREFIAGKVGSFQAKELTRSEPSEDSEAISVDIMIKSHLAIMQRVLS